MNCPRCGTATVEAQNYCGGCGHQIQNICSGCGTTNPPLFKFCGQCGQDLAAAGAVLLDRAGLILEADAVALSLLQVSRGKVKGRPFSLYVKIDDLVVFYSHWNELLRAGQTQRIEVELTPTKERLVHVRMVLSLLDHPQSRASRIHIEITDVSDRRQALRDLQEMQDLTRLIFSFADTFCPSQGLTRIKTIGGILEKICLFVEAQYGVICRIAPTEKQLATEFEWRHPDVRHSPPPSPAIAFSRLRPVLARLQNDGRYIVHDTNQLVEVERLALQAWLPAEPTAVLGHLMYGTQGAVGVIAVARRISAPWSHQAVALVKLSGRLMADCLAQVRPGRNVIHAAPAPPRSQTAAEAYATAIDLSEYEVIVEAPATPAKKSPPHRAGAAAVDTDPNKSPARMRFAVDKKRGAKGRQPVFSHGDGRYHMICPECGFEDAVPGRIFEKAGSALRVKCPCDCEFRIIREMRSGFRKAVRLEGFFARGSGDHAQMAASGVWGAMVVTNLSRNGLSFNGANVGRLRIGDKVQVRFQLDNSSRTLIKRGAKVRSLQGDSAGCQFTGSDRSDVTLGFYFL